MKQPFLPLALCLLLSACSVKEDRRPCPCLLSIIASDAFTPEGATPDTEWNLTLTGYAEEGKIVEERFDAESVRDTLEYSVKKGDVLVTALLARAETRSFADGTYRIPAGSQAEAFYAWREAVDASGETVSCTLHPHKQFSTLCIYDRSDRDTPFGGAGIALRGSVCGMDLRSLSPVVGPFHCGAMPVETAAGRVFRCRIPRQREDDLMLEIGDSFTVPLGKILFQNGYDPETEDLPDFTVTVESARLTAGIEILPWDVITLEVII